MSTTTATAAKKARTTVPNRAGDLVTVYGELHGDTVHVWVANGPRIGGYRLERFAGGILTAATLRAVLTGGK